VGAAFSGDALEMSPMPSLAATPTPRLYRPARPRRHTPPAPTFPGDTIAQKRAAFSAACARYARAFFFFRRSARRHWQALLVFVSFLCMQPRSHPRALAEGPPPCRATAAAAPRFMAAAARCRRGSASARLCHSTRSSSRRCRCPRAVIIRLLPLTLYAAAPPPLPAI